MRVELLSLKKKKTRKMEEIKENCSVAMT